MNTIACLTLSWFLSLSFFLTPSIAFSGTEVDPHGKKEMCRFCHGAQLVKEGKPQFRLSTVEATCLKCHGGRGATLEDYLGRMLPDVENKDKMISYMTKHPDFSCHSCHSAMCLRNSRKELQYRNPHIQLDKEGKIIEQACLFCHTSVPNYNYPSPQHTTMRYSLSYLCSVCHAMNAQKRGLGLGKPMTAAMVRKKEQFEKEYDVSLPLGPGNTVVCASCHNPHEIGVTVGRSGNSASSAEHRLVLEDIWMMCTACHLGDYEKTVGKREDESGLTNKTFSPLVPVSAWVGERFVFLPRQYKRSTRLCYDSFYVGEKYYEFPSYSEYVGRTAQVVSCEKLYDHWEVQFEMLDSGQRLSASARSGGISGIALAEDINSARDRWVGKTLWYKREKMSTYDSFSGKVTSFRLRKNMQVKVIDVVASWDNNTPVRFILQTPDGKEGFVDMAWSGTNSYEFARRNLDRFQTLFYSEDPMKSAGL